MQQTNGVLQVVGEIVSIVVLAPTVSRTPVLPSSTGIQPEFMRELDL